MEEKLTSWKDRNRAWRVECECCMSGARWALGISERAVRDEKQIRIHSRMAAAVGGSAEGHRRKIAVLLKPTSVEKWQDPLFGRRDARRRND